jgi:ABC-2 type transport system ATP-binding protein
MDAATTAHFWTTIRALAKQKTTILIATHNFAEATAVADRLLLLHRGELLADRRVLEHENADELRSFYFRMTGEIDEAALKI